MNSQDSIALTQLKPKRKYVKRHSFFKPNHTNPPRVDEPATTTADAEDAKIKRLEGAAKRRRQEKQMDHSEEWQYTKRGWNTAERQRNYPKITTFYKITKEQLTLEELKEESQSSMMQSVAENRPESVAL